MCVRPQSHTPIAPLNTYRFLEMSFWLHPVHTTGSVSSRPWFSTSGSCGKCLTRPTPRAAATHRADAATTPVCAIIARRRAALRGPRYACSSCSASSHCSHHSCWSRSSIMDAMLHRCRLVLRTLQGGHGQLMSRAFAGQWLRAWPACVTPRPLQLWPPRARRRQQLQMPRLPLPQPLPQPPPQW